MTFLIIIDRGAKEEGRNEEERRGQGGREGGGAVEVRRKGMKEVEGC